MEGDGARAAGRPSRPEYVRTSQYEYDARVL